MERRGNQRHRHRRGLRAILAGVGTLEGPYHSPEDNERLQEFREAIEDDASYTIDSIEF